MNIMNIHQSLCMAGRLPVFTSRLCSGKRLLCYTAQKSSKSDAKTVQSPSEDPSKVRDNNQESKPKVTRSVAQADEELRERLEQMSGEGGASGIEYEDGKPTAMKRSVRNNMFRYI